MVPSSIFDVNQYLKYDNDKQQPLFDHAFSVKYTVGFSFLNKYYATKNHPYGGKGGIINNPFGGNVESFQSFEMILIFLMEIIVQWFSGL